MKIASNLEKNYVLVIDEGTSSTKGFVFDDDYQLRGCGYRDLTTFADACGRAEMDAEEIWQKSVAACRDAIAKAGISPEQIACVGIANQRTTLVVWDRNTGKPLHNVITWQDARTCMFNEQFERDGILEYLGNYHGKLEPFYGIVLLYWLVQSVPHVAAKVRTGEALCGSVDSWLLYKLTGGKSIAASYDCAATIGYIRGYDLKLAQELLDYLEIPSNVFPEPKENLSLFGLTDPAIFGVSIPVTGIIADQHASMFAQGVLQKGSCKCTNGTGSFFDLNVGSDFVPAKKEFSVFLTWVLSGVPSYVVEGTILCTGTFLRWAKNQLKLFESYEELSALAEAAPEDASVLVIPMLYGMLYPYADRSIRANFLGATEDTDLTHFSRAMLEGVNFSILVAVEKMCKILDLQSAELKVDGGISQSDVFCRIMNESFGIPILRADVHELTALGAAHMAFIGAGISSYESLENVINYQSFAEHSQRTPEMERKYTRWLKALERCSNWTF